MLLYAILQHIYYRVLHVSLYVCFYVLYSQFFCLFAEVEWKVNRLLTPTSSSAGKAKKLSWKKNGLPLFSVLFEIVYQTACGPNTTVGSKLWEILERCRRRPMTATNKKQNKKDDHL